MDIVRTAAALEACADGDRARWPRCDASLVSETTPGAVFVNLDGATGQVDFAVSTLGPLEARAPVTRRPTDPLPGSEKSGRCPFRHRAGVQAGGADDGAGQLRSADDLLDRHVADCR